VRSRAILTAILIVALAGVLPLSVISKGRAIEFEPFGAVAVLIFVLAILGRRLAWGIAFVISALSAGFGLVLALTASHDQAFGWLGAALYGIAALALWGLNPDLRTSMARDPQDAHSTRGAGPSDS